MEQFIISVTMGQNTIENLLDKGNIKELIEYERYCRDYEHFDVMRTLYFDDAQVWTSWYKGDAENFVKKSQETSEAKGRNPSKHKISNILVWLNGNKAIAECICTIHIRDKMDDELIDLLSNVRLHYKVEKREDGIWKICAFQGIHERDTLSSAFNDGKWVAPREEVQKFRPSFWNQLYRHHAYQSMGNTPQDESVGEDKPELVKALYEESTRWLFS
jgi:hypothetical protein